MMAPERFVRRGRVMRFVGLLLAAFAFIQQAHAADMGGILRGAMRRSVPAGPNRTVTLF